MDRRDAMKGLASLAAATGFSVSPVTTKDAEQVALIVLRVKSVVSQEGLESIRRYWRYATADTALADVQVVVLTDDVDVEFVRR